MVKARSWKRYPAHQGPIMGDRPGGWYVSHVVLSLVYLKSWFLDRRLQFQDGNRQEVLAESSTWQ